MINYIIINGTNSNTINGLGINELPPISKPPLRVQTEEIDGRDGDISTNLGYGAYDKTITIGLFGTGYDINEVISFFNGEGTVVFSNEPDKYYKYKIINQIDYEALLKFKSATITFHCQPFKYPLTETPLEIEYEYIEQEGVESATMNNTNGGTSLKIDLKGNTSQPTTTGINEFSSDTSIWVGSSAGKVNYDSSTDVFTFHRDSGVDYLLGNGKLGLKANTRYTIYVDVLENTMTSNFNVVEGSSNLPFLLLIGANTTGKYVVSTITGSLEKNYDLWIYCNSTGTLKAKIMLVEGEYTSETIPNYEKFTYGASPNPDYPQPIHVVSGDNEVVVCGKNLLDLSRSSLSRCTLNSDGSLTSNISNSYFSEIEVTYLNDYILSKKGETITFSTKQGITGKRMSIIINGTRTGGTAYQEVSNAVGERSVSLTIADDFTEVTSICLRFNRDRTRFDDTTTIIQEVMLEQNSTATTYEPYQSQTYPINLGELELCKIGDYQDYFTKNSEGQWCKYNAIGKAVLDGSENFNNYSNNVSGLYKCYTTDVTIGLDAGYRSNDVLSDYFASLSYISTDTTTIGFATTKYATYFSISTDTANSTTDFKTWLGTHNTTLNYVLATPYLSLIEDETLKSQLDNIQNALSYDSQTNVSQVNNDKPFLLDLIAMEKGTDEVVINNIGNVYAKPTIALEGTGETDIYLNNTEILKVDLSEKNKITIDTNNMEAYDPTDNSLANRKVIGNYNSMTLPSGNTTMKITGALDKATITNYTRWL